MEGLVLETQDELIGLIKLKFKRVILVNNSLTMGIEFLILSVDIGDVSLGVFEVIFKFIDLKFKMVLIWALLNDFSVILNVDLIITKL